MSKKQGKQKRVEVIPVNYYRKIALIANPIILVVLAILIILKVPFEAVLVIGVAAYAVWAVVFIKANMTDRRNHGKR